jgi:hypothetical protein
VLGAQLPGELAQALLAPRDERDALAAPGELTRDRGSDARGGAGDEGRRGLCGLRERDVETLYIARSPDPGTPAAVA